jgi:hypothetical protein
MSLRTFRGASAAALLALVTLAACNKDPDPKPIKDEPKKTTPVPEDMVLNDFLPPSGGAEGLAVRVDGGLPEAGAEGAAAEGAPAGEGDMKVTDPGAEPRAPRRYAFVANRAEKRTLVIRQSVSQQGQTQEQPPLALTVEFTPKDVKPAATRFDMKVISVDLADKEKLDPRLVAQAGQELALFKGLSATFTVSSRGDVGEVSLSGSEKMQREGAAEMLDAFSQFVELILAPLPEAPIGQGAKWEMQETRREQGIEQSSKRTLELKELTAEGGTIVSRIEKKVPKRRVPDPRMPPDTMMEVDAAGSYTYAFRFDRVATKVTGEQTSKVKIDVPAGEDGQKKTVVQEAKVRHSMEAPPATKAAAQPAAQPPTP